MLVESTRVNLLNDVVHPSFMYCAKTKKKKTKHFFVIVIFKVEKFQGELHGLVNLFIHTFSN